MSTDNNAASAGGFRFKANITRKNIAIEVMGTTTIILIERKIVARPRPALVGLAASFIIIYKLRAIRNKPIIPTHDKIIIVTKLGLDCFTDSAVRSRVFLHRDYNRRLHGRATDLNITYRRTSGYDKSTKSFKLSR